MIRALRPNATRHLNQEISLASRDASIGADHAHESFVAISQCDGLVTILPDSAHSSGVVRRRVEFAISLRTPVFPVGPYSRAMTLPYARDLLLICL